MNDDFLRSLRSAPRPEFADALYRQLNDQVYLPAVSRFRRSALMSVALAVCILSLTLFSSPVARAAISQIFTQVGDQTFATPADLGIEWEIAQIEAALDPQCKYYQQRIPLALAQARLPFELGTLEQLPDGILLRDTAVIEVGQSPLDLAILDLLTADGELVEYRTWRTNPLFVPPEALPMASSAEMNQSVLIPASTQVGSKVLTTLVSVETALLDGTQPDQLFISESVPREVTVNGAPAAMLQADGMTRLIWQDGDVSRSLGVESGTVSAEALIAIAERLE